MKPFRRVVRRSAPPRLPQPLLPQSFLTAARRFPPAVSPAVFGVLLLVAALLLPACSSGGDSPTEPGSSGPAAASVESGSFARINSARRAEGRTELMLDPALSEVARRHSERMRDAQFFSHDDPNGTNPVSRVRAAGIGFSLLGENLATVSGSPDPASTAHSALMGNPEHRNNILEPRFTLVGVGVARSGSSYWITQVFIRP